MTEVARASDAVNELADRFWDGILELSPVTATIYGYERGADRLDDPGPDGRAAARELFTATLRGVDEIAAASGDEGVAPSDDARDGSRLSVEDRVTLDILRVVCEMQLEQLDQRVDRLKVLDQSEGPQTILPLLATMQRTDTPERLGAFVARLEAYPAFMAANAELAREGLASGLTAARIVTERVIAQLERVLAVAPEDSAIVASLPRLDDADRDRIVRLVRDVVRPADAAFLDALRGPYLEASRVEPGLWSAPDGEALYRTQVRAWTTLPLDPAEVHRIGLEELASIEGERRTIARSLGFGDDTNAAREAIRTGPGHVPQTEEEYLERARGQIERAFAAAPRFFGRLPRSGCEVRPVEPYKQADSPFAYYYPPAADGSRPGIYYVNTYDLPSRSYSQLADTSFHEAVPGHHFQIALEVENESLNVFRRLGSRMAGSAYTEGWALYTERLADEMGLYLDETERFGMLDGQSWRAARLVVDTGIHAFRWSRDRSIEALRAAGLSETDAVIETDRYIAWPAQALTYKTGQREIERLRVEVSRRLGPAFDLRAFHDAVLGHGTLPLATLSAELPRWLGAAEQGTAE